MSTVETEYTPISISRGSGTVRISGTPFDAQRYGGPPSKLFPLLRDLAINPSVLMRDDDVTPRITIEVDTQGARFTGVIQGYAKNPEVLYLQSKPHRQAVKFDKILAFRVVKVEVPK